MNVYIWPRGLVVVAQDLAQARELTNYQGAALVKQAKGFPTAIIPAQDFCRERVLVLG